MAGRGWVHKWVCREDDCPEGGEGTNGKSVDSEAARHTRRTKHATTKWSEAPLPIEMRR